MTEQTTATRQRRSDGEQTHSAILAAAVRLASMEGLGALTLGRLAQEVGVSKSGLYAHFGSKHQLQIDVFHAAREIFQQEVIEPAFAATEGLPRLERLCESYVSYIERRVFPGGCFFAGMLAEFDAQTGSPHLEVTADQQEWLGLLETLVRQAQNKNELDANADLDQLVFDITATVQLTNYYHVLFRDPAIIDRGRRGIRSAITRAKPATPYA